jgi:hypothetical protein
VSLPANLVALPLASPIMSWGVVAGIPAGLLGHNASAVIHVPTRLLLSAVAAVARGAASLPLGSLSSIDLVVGAALVGLLFVVRRGTTGPSRALIVVALLVVMSLPSARAMSPWGTTRPSGRWVLAPAVEAFGGSGTAMVRRLDVLVVAHGASPSVVLRRLRAERIGAVDAVVVVSGGRPQKSMLRALHHRIDIGVVISPPSVGAPIGVAWKQAQAGLVLTARASIIRIESVKGNKVDIRVE